MLLTRWKIASAALGLALAALPTHASAAPGETATATGTATATKVDAASLLHVEDLRFGAFMSPVTNSTLRIAPDGTVTPTGDVVNTYTIPQPATGRGPAEFLLTAAGSRAFLVFTPNRIDISNGTSTMRVNRFRSSMTRRSPTSDPNGVYDLNIGGDLIINANQEAGYYTGTFDVFVFYL